jgi:LPS-assembly protein
MSKHPRKKRLLKFLMISIVLWPAALWAQTLPELTADNPILISQDGDSLVAKGNAQLSQNRFFLAADSLVFDKSQDGGTASGHASVGAPPFRLVSDTIQYSLSQKAIQTPGFKLSSAPLFLSGDHLTGNNERIEIDNATAYWQEPDAFSPNICCKNIVYEPQSETITAKHAVFKVGKLPFFYLPYVKARTFERPFSLSGKAGYRSELGGFARTQTLFTLMPGFQIGANADYYAKRGFLVGPSLHTDIDTHGIKAHGELETGFIHDHGPKSKDSFGKDIPHSRSFISWREKIKIEDSLTGTIKIDKWSDPYITRDFKPEYFRDNQQPDNFAEATLQNDRYYLTFFSRFRLNDFQTYIERLPEITFNWVPSTLGHTGIYHQFSASIAHLKKRTLYDLEPTLSTNRFDAYYGLFKPFKLNDWATLTPVAGVRITHYGDIHEQGQKTQPSDYTRFLGQIGADLVFKAYGLWDTQNKRLQINGLRHNLTPLIQYRYIPDANQGQDRIPHLDDAPFTTYPQLIDLSERRDIDHFSASHVLRFGLQNTLDTKSIDYGSYQLAYLNLYQDLRFQPEPNNRGLSDFYTELGIQPWKWISFDAFSRIDSERLTLKELNTSFSIKDGKKWKLTLGNAFFQDLTNQYWILWQFALNQRNRIKITLRYDMRRSDLIEQCYSYWFKLSHAWTLEPYIRRLIGAKRETGWDTGIYVNLIN